MLAVACGSLLRGQPLVSVQSPGESISSNPALQSVQPMKLVLIYDESPTIDYYLVTLNWRDQSGAPQTTSKSCNASRTGPMTVCVFYIDASSTDMPSVQPFPFKRPSTKEIHGGDPVSR